MTAPALTNYANGVGQVSGDQFNTFAQTCDNFAQLRGLTGVSGIQVFARGAVNPSDGAGGAFWWNPNNTSADDNNNVIVPGGVTLGGWNRLYYGGSQVGAVGNIASLRGLTSGISPVWVEGYYSAGDGGEGMFNLGTAAPDNGGTIIVSSSGTYYRETGDNPYSVKWFGAYGNGTSDDSAAIIKTNSAAATAGVSVLFSSGSYRITSNIPFTSPVIIAQGAVLDVATGCTLTFGQPLTAGIYGIFSLAGTASVVFSGPQDGRPEWWGAVVDSSSVDSTFAINACIIACTKTLLQAGTYYTTNSVVCRISNRVIEGGNQGYFPEAGTVGTTLVALESATAHGFVIGSSSDPGSVNNFPSGIVVRRLSQRRTVPVVPPASGSEISAASGFFVDYVLSLDIEDCTANQNSIGFTIQNAVQCHFNRLKSVRSTPGTTSTNDIYWGYLLNGNSTYYLESCYFTDCLSYNAYPSSPSSIGFNIIGTFTDCYLLRPEADVHQFGLFANGSLANKPSIDNQIIGGVFDQCWIYGVLIQSQPAGSIITMTDNYVVMAQQATVIAAFAALNNLGVISFDSNQSYNPYGGSMVAIGLYIYQSVGVQATSNQWVDMSKPVAINSCISCRIEDTISNFSTTASQAAVVIIGSSRLVIDSQIFAGTGSAALFPVGVSMDSATGYSEVRCTGINSGCIVGGAANKLVYNGTQITAQGTFGSTNLAQGVMA